MSKYLESWQNALDQVHNWKPGTNTHQQILKEAAPSAGVSGGGVKKDDHFEKVKKVKDQINKQKDKVAKFDLGDPKQKTPHALATADLKTMNLKLRDMQSAENEPETDDAGKPNKKKQIKEEPLNEKKADFLRLTFANNQTVKKVERWLYNNLGRANPGYMSMIADDDFIDFEDMNDADGVMTKLKKAGFSFKVDMRWNTTSWREGLNKDDEYAVSIAGIETERQELNEGLQLSNLVGQSIAHLEMYVELAEDVKKEYFKTKSQVSMFTKIKAEQVLKNVPKLIKELKKPGIWSEQVELDEVNEDASDMVQAKATGTQKRIADLTTNINDKEDRARNINPGDKNKVAIHKADMNHMKLKLSDLKDKLRTDRHKRAMAAQNEPETDTSGKPNKKKEITENE